MNDLVKTSIEGRKNAIFSAYNVTDQNIIDRIDELFNRINEFGESCVDNMDFETNFSAVAATLNNIGPGLQMVGPTENYSAFSNLSKIVLIFDMLAGRLELFPMLVLFSPYILSPIF